MCTCRISQALLHGLIGVGLVAIISKIHRWDESAMFFDGGSLGERRPIQYLHPPPFTLTGGKGGAHVPHARTE